MERLNFTSRSNADYIEELFEEFLKNPDSVEADWKLFFEGVEFGRQLKPAQIGPKEQQTSNISSMDPDSLDKEIRVYRLIRAYRALGHNKAHIDPLEENPSKLEALELAAFGLTEADLDKEFYVGNTLKKRNCSLREIIKHLENAYCKTITAEFSGLEPEMHRWVVQEFEHTERIFSASEKKQILKDLNDTDALEKFFHTRYVGMKRFSIEGSDSLIPMLETFVYNGIEMGLEEIVIGMAHRGRINVLTNFMNKAIEIVFAEFDGRYDPDITYADSDVKYHMGFSVDKETEKGKCHISLAFNPSHLECVAPVAMGMTRAKQRIKKDENRVKVIPVIIHGDAAFIGQGVVSETLQLSNLPGYTVGGTIHIVLNNQVGFTTDPEYSRSTRYCTDVVKQLAVPIIHVNGDDPEACIRAMNIALRFRQHFHSDIVIDLVTYRKHGHNESEEPAFTQPLMYKKIKNHKSPRELYGEKLIQEGVIDKNYLEKLFKGQIDHLQLSLEKSRKENTFPKFDTLGGVWSGLRRSKPEDFERAVETGVPLSTLQEVTKALVTVPENFKIHPKLQKLLDKRKNMFETGNAIDWGMAELLSYGSLVKEGISVRLSGQDSGRGTFSHRHSIFIDITNNQRHNPLSTLGNEDTGFFVHDSSLSEMAVLGFEYGNSTTDPRFLNLWEAQFGDFANGAQIIIDQFITSAESKWQRMSGLVLLLPHGYEGQGPEHSSARLERFLQLSAQNNIQVCNLTTPAQLFHVFRRQLKRDFRKPLVIMSPKSLLRHPKVISSAKDLTDGRFEEVLLDNSVKARNVKRCILCTGKVYYEILKEREKSNRKDDTAIIRLEQIQPFPSNKLFGVISAYTKLEEFIWAQEEPKNMGAYLFVAFRLQEIFMRLKNPGIRFRYVGRTERASPAIGNPHLHKQEQEEIIKGCFK